MSRARVVNATPEQIAKLPVWAQDRIRHAESAAKRAEERFAELGHVMDQFEDLPAGGISYGDWQRAIEIPRGDKITFHMGDSTEIEIRFTPEENALHISGSRTLEFHPMASNVLQLALERDRIREKLLEARAEKQAANILARPKDFDGGYRKSRKDAGGEPR